MLGNGDGTFQTAAMFDSGGVNAPSVALADVNRDGKPDLVVANICLNITSCPNGSVSILLGNGDGTFKAPVSYLSGGLHALKVAVGDLNEDGLLDVAVANYGASNNFGVLSGNGDGTFQQVISYGSGGEGAVSIVLADVNGDAKLDILVVDQYGNGNDVGLVGVLLNNTTKGKSSTSTSCLLPESLHLWTEGYLDSDGYLLGISHANRHNQVHVEWQHDRFGNAQQQRRGDPNQVKSNCRYLSAEGGVCRRRRQSRQHVYCGEPGGIGDHEQSQAHFVAEPVHARSGGDVHCDDYVADSDTNRTITFTAGTTVLGTAQLGGGKAKLVISSLPVGSTKVTVKYNGDSNIAKSSASVLQTVQ